MTQQTDLKGQYNFILFQITLFTLPYLLKNNYHIYTENIQIPSWNFFSKTK